MYTGDDKDDLSTEIRKRWTDSRDALSDWRQEARTDFAFVAGDQWSDEDKSALEEQKRPAITFNRVGPLVDSVSGVEINNRQETRYLPRELGDVQLNEILTYTAKWVRQGCHADDEDSDAFRDASICGIGASEMLMDYQRDPDGKIVIERRDPLHCTWDTQSRKKCLEDARYIFNAEWLHKDDAKARWPEAELFTSDELWKDEKAPHNADRAYLYEGATDHDLEQHKDSVLVLHYQCWKLEKYVRALDPFSGKIASFEQKEFDALRDKVKPLGLVFTDGKKTAENEIPYVRQHRRVYYRGFMIGDELLEYGKLPVQSGFTIKFITARRDRNKNTWYGIVRALRDPQQWANKWLSQILHIINTNAKGGAFVEENALADPRKAEEQWGSNDAPLIILKEGGIDKVRERTATTYPSGLDRLMNLAFQSIPMVSGINLEMLGLADREQAGILEEQRKKSAMAILAPLFDAKKRYGESQGELLLEFIQKFISDERLVRIIGKNGDIKFIPLTRNVSIGSYDVVVSESPESPDFKREVWQSMQQILPLMLKNGYEIPDAIFDLSPAPSWVTEKIKASLKEQMPPIAKQKLMEMGQQLKQTTEALQKLQMENLQLKVDASVDVMKVERNYDSKIMSIQQKAQSADQDHVIEQARLLVDARSSQTDERIAMIDSEIRKFEAQQAAQHKTIEFVQSLMEKSRETETANSTRAIADHTSTLAQVGQVVAQAAQVVAEASKPKPTGPRRVKVKRTADGYEVRE